MIETRLFGRTPDGDAVLEYVLTNSNKVKASFLNLGAIWHKMIVPDKKGIMKDVVLGLADIEDFLTSDAHPGEIIGRNANRISGGMYEIGEMSYMLICNSGKNNLHSGPDYFRNRIWAAKEKPDENAITFSLNSKKYDQGYPGAMKIAVTYTLTEDNSVKIHYEAISDEDTICNMTNHAYFNLAGHNAGSVLDHEVMIKSDYITAFNENSVPTGEIRSVMATPMDFTDFKAIRDDIFADYDQLKFGKGYDHNYILNHAKGELALAAVCRDPQSGRTMEVYTDLPGVQFYTANWLHQEVPAKDGCMYIERDGLCFETQFYPDAVNHPEFPSPILKAGEKFDSTTIYKFK